MSATLNWMFRLMNRYNSALVYFLLCVFWIFMRHCSHSYNITPVHIKCWMIGISAIFCAWCLPCAILIKIKYQCAGFLAWAAQADFNRLSENNLGTIFFVVFFICRQSTLPYGDLCLYIFFSPTSIDRLIFCLFFVCFFMFVSYSSSVCVAILLAISIWLLNFFFFLLYLTTNPILFTFCAILFFRLYLFGYACVSPTDKRSDD